MIKPRKARRHEHWNTTVLRDELVARPLRHYHEDMGTVLWWRLPIHEPPYVGTPNGSQWIDDYYTHFTPIVVPLTVVS